MSHTHAHATHLAATNCAACGRALVDAESLAHAIGPICRQRYGSVEKLDGGRRPIANKIIHAIATSEDAIEVAKLIDDLKQIAPELEDVADRIHKRWGKRIEKANEAARKAAEKAKEEARKAAKNAVKVKTLDGGSISIASPYVEGMRGHLQGVDGSAGVKWDSHHRVWVLTHAEPAALREKLKSLYPHNDLWINGDAVSWETPLPITPMSGEETPKAIFKSEPNLRVRVNLSPFSKGANGVLKRRGAKADYENGSFGGWLIPMNQDWGSIHAELCQAYGTPDVEAEGDLPW